MADESFILAEEELSCPICFEEYEQFDSKRHPKLLLCLHTFCFECIETLRKPFGSMQCSICRTEHDVKDLSELLDNYLIFEYLERKQLLEDEEMANKLNEEETTAWESEDVPQDEIVEPVIDLESSLESNEAEILEDICPEEELDGPLNEYEENEQCNISSTDPIPISDQNPVEAENCQDDQNISANSVYEDESDASYNSPAESLSLTENNVKSEEEDVLRGATPDNPLFSSTPLPIIPSSSEYSDEESELHGILLDEPESNMDQMLATVTRRDSELQNVDQSEDSWETEEEEEEYCHNNEVRRLKILERKFRQNLYCEPVTPEACTFQ